MVFSSVTFLFLYLPIILGIYHLVLLPATLGFPRRLWIRAANLWLLLASLLFYAWGEKQLVWLFIGTTFVDFASALIISGALWQRSFDKLPEGGTRSFVQRFVLIASICCNLGLLIYFKYFTFAITSYNTVVKKLGASQLIDHPIDHFIWRDLPTLALPLGISFFIFHSMSYVIDVYRGHVKATRNFIDYACYVLMFPQLVAGPIVRFSYVADSLIHRVVTARYFASGVVTFTLGLSKKVLIANHVAIPADRIFAMPLNQLTPQLAWLGAIAYTLQIYFDFSGYSDMAIGLGRMLGFELPQNFNFPYIARNVREFWRRWHISLSTWFQDYLYIPLGGSRVSPLRTQLNLITVFLLCGLWHGASWTFVVWGAYHGLFLAIERVRVIDRLLARLGVFSHVYTMLAVVFGWVLFRADTLAQARAFMLTMLGFGSTLRSQPASWFLTPDVVIALIAGCLLSIPILHIVTTRIDAWLKRPSPSRQLLVPPIAAARVVSVMALLVVCAMTLASGTHNPFIYFRF